MPEVSQLQRPKPTTTSVDLGDGDTIKITFDRNKITRAWVEGADDAITVSKALADVILTWDVTSNGEPFPASEANLSAFSYPAQMSLLRRIMAAAIPSDAEGNASSEDSSSQPEAFTPASPSSRNGQETSPSPEPSASPSPT